MDREREGSGRVEKEGQGYRETEDNREPRERRRELRVILVGIPN